jgi:rubrerythrin
MVVQEQTRQGLQSAFAEEAEETVRYLLYAEQAEREGHPELAALFAEAARRDALAYARIHAQLLGEVGGTAENLARAIRREIADSTELYPALARQAAAAGNEALAAHLAQIAAAKEYDLQALQRAYLAVQEESRRAAIAKASDTGNAGSPRGHVAPVEGAIAPPDFVPNGRNARREAASLDETLLFMDDLAEDMPGASGIEAMLPQDVVPRHERTDVAQPNRQRAQGKAARRWGA